MVVPGAGLFVALGTSTRDLRGEANVRRNFVSEFEFSCLYKDYELLHARMMTMCCARVMLRDGQEHAKILLDAHGFAYGLETSSFSLI